MTQPSPFDLATISLWPTQFFVRQWLDHSRHATMLIDHFYTLRDAQKTNIESGVASMAKAAAGLYESHFDLFADPHPSVQALADFTRETLGQTVSRVNGGEVKSKDIIVEFADSWYHITNDGGFHDAHFHGGCSWCGIYYARVGASGKRMGGGGGAPNGGSRFYSPIAQGGAYKDYGNKYLVASVDPPISDGLLLLFPSYLLHSGLPYQGPEDRVVVAFNAKVFISEDAVLKLRKR